MKKITILFTLFMLAFNPVSGQTIFNFDSPNTVDHGGYITEVVSGITMTLSGNPDLSLAPGNNLGGSSGNIALTTSGTPVVASIIDGRPPRNVPVALNWTNVTTITVTSIRPDGAVGAGFVFDDISVNARPTMFINDDYKSQISKIYPNPVESILYIKNVTI